jgi:hypothetical protein
LPERNTLDAPGKIPSSSNAMIPETGTTVNSMGRETWDRQAPPAPRDPIDTHMMIEAGPAPAGNGPQVDQYESALTTSPWARVPRAHQVGAAIESFMNFTEPSHMHTFTPPGWLLVAVIRSFEPPGAPPQEFAATHEIWFGVMKWL